MYIVMMIEKENWDKSTLFYLGNFNFLKNGLGQFIPNRSPKHVITSTNYAF